MGCGGSTEVKSGAGESSNGKVVPFDRRPKISVRVGPQAKKIDGSPGCVFIFGGPGSRKGRIVDDLVSSYGFQFICGEDLILQELPKKVSNIIKLETIKDIKNFIDDDPSHITLSWLLSCVERRLELGRAAGTTYLIDIIPNLRYLLKAEGLIHEDLQVLEKFEEKYPISFGLNLAIPVDKILNAKSNYCVQPDGTKMKESGGQSDEADSSRTQKRAALYEQSAQPFLNYFAKTERLVTVDVTCGVADLIWHQVHDVMMDLDFDPGRVVNTVVVFGWTDSDLAEINVDKYQMERVQLRSLLDDNDANSDNMEKMLGHLSSHIDNQSRQNDAFVVSLEGTKLAKVANPQPTDEKKLLTTSWWEKRKGPKVTDRPITFIEVEEGYLETYLPGSPKNCTPQPGSRRMKVICTLENEVYLFPTTTDDKVAINIATVMASTRRVM